MLLATARWLQSVPEIRDREDLNKFLISIHTVQTLLRQSFKQSSISGRKSLLVIRTWPRAMWNLWLRGFGSRDLKKCCNLFYP
jgi:hypothetical protein